MKSAPAHPGRTALLVALAAAAWAAALGGLAVVALGTDRGDSIARWLDLEDLLFTIPVAGLVAVAAGVVALVRARRRRALAALAIAAGLLGLLASGLVLAALLAAGSVLDQL